MNDRQNDILCLKISPLLFGILLFHQIEIFPCVVPGFIGRVTLFLHVGDSEWHTYLEEAGTKKEFRGKRSDFEGTQKYRDETEGRADQIQTNRYTPTQINHTDQEQDKEAQPVDKKHNKDRKTWPKLFETRHDLVWFCRPPQMLGSTLAS